LRQRRRRHDDFTESDSERLRADAERIGVGMMRVYERWSSTDDHQNL